MDTDLLVDSLIDDGQKLINQLNRDMFDVAAAFWVKRSDQSLWQLWLASSAVEGQNRGEALHTVYSTLDKIPGCEVTPMDITLVNDTDPVARAAITVRDRYRKRAVLHLHEMRLGNLEIEEAYIYPRRFPLDVRKLHDGRWEVLVSRDDDVWLACESEEDARAIAAAPVLEYETLKQVRSGADFATEVQKTADVLEKYHMSFGSHFFGRPAAELRR